jgi:hypothetical protein
MRNRGKSTHFRVALLAVIAGLLVPAAPAVASPNQEMVLQDDPNFVHWKSPFELDYALRYAKRLGVDRIRVSVYWDLIAPRPNRRRRPRLRPSAASPLAYRQAAWDRYDAIVKLAARNGLGVLFTVTGSAGKMPKWAVKRGRRRGRPDNPKPREFRDFVRALGTRYSGRWPDPRAPRGTFLPRVTHWSLWNEPNFSTASPVRRRNRFPLSAAVYRRLLDGAYSGLVRSGHGADTILLGETSPISGRFYPGQTKRTIGPLKYVRDLYCVTRRFRRYRGRAARRRGCPRTAGARRRFAARHPVLFRAAGFAHHPYTKRFRPTFRYRDRDTVTLGNLRRLERTLDRALSRWGVRRRLPIWITEYGYQTRPPDPFNGVSWERQAEWMSWSEFLSYRDPRVASFAQFLLVDDKPVGRFRRRRDPRRWVTWQSGLYTAQRTAKPLATEFVRSIHLDPADVRPGRSVRVWGIYRNAPPGAVIPARVEFQGADGVWRTLAQVLVRNPRGYLDTRVRPPGEGALRIVWSNPGTGRAATTALRSVRR